jgi:hypothetical protein
MRLGEGLSLTVALLMLALLGLWLLPIESMNSHRFPPPIAGVPSIFAAGSRCYRLTFVPPEFARRIPRDEGQGMPELLRIMTDTIPDYPGSPATFRRAYSSPSGQRDEGPSRWRRSGPDSIDVGIPTLAGVVGVQMRISSTGDTLVGRAWPYFDTPSYSFSPDARVTATPLPCPVWPCIARATGLPWRGALLAGERDAKHR